MAIGMARGAPPLLLLALSLLLAPSAAQDDIDGCGGFVRASASLSSGVSKPDLSTISAALVSADGLVKSTTECSPNGYFYVPIYDKAQYTLRVQGPAGFIFEPAEQKVSTADGLCGQGKDVDFSIVGFALAGRVTSDGLDEGPAGVKMTLQGKDGSKSTTTTTAGGFYSFTEAKPGVDYKITASHDEWKFKKATTTAKLEFGASEVTEKFGVLGYTIKAKLTAGGDPPKLTFTLHPVPAASRPSSLPCTAPSGGGGGVVLGRERRPGKHPDRGGPPRGLRVAA